MRSALLKSINTDYLTNVVKVRGFPTFFHIEIAARRFQVKGIPKEGEELYKVVQI